MPNSPSAVMLIFFFIAGPDSSIAELTDFICAAQMSKAADALLPPEEKVLEFFSLAFRTRSSCKLSSFLFDS